MSEADEVRVATLKTLYAQGAKRMEAPRGSSLQHVYDTFFGQIMDELGICPSSEVLAFGAHPEERCERCWGPNLPVWHAPSPLWNAVMRGADGSDLWSIVCPQCFAELAAEKGIIGKSAWCLRLQPMPDLPQRNVDGRVWDDAQCLWVDEAAT